MTRTMTRTTMRRALAAACMAVLMPAPALADWTIVHAGRLMAVPGQALLDQASVIVRDDRVVAVREGFASAADLDNPGGLAVTVVDLKDKVVLPGLIDAHVHLDSVPGETRIEELRRPDSYYAVLATANAKTTLKAGFTTVRDVGSRPDTTHAVRDAIADGHIAGPRVLSSGPSISIVGGHGDESHLSRQVLSAFPAERTGVCSGVAECRRRVREASKYGADLIKITATGGVLSQQARGFGQHFADDELAAIMETAHFLGLKVAAHAHGAGGVDAALRAGVDSIEHGTYLTDASVKLFKRSGAYLVPTLAAFTGIREGLDKGYYTPAVQAKVRAILDVIGQGLAKAHRAGVNIAFGTDAGVFPHGRNAEEFALMVEYGGMSPEATIVSATVSAAELLGVADDVGTLQAGKYADLIAVAGNPLEDVTELERVAFVMKGGRVVVGGR